MKNILITGGAGFIGSHLSEKFHKEGFRVIVLDNLFRGNKTNLVNIPNEEMIFANIDLVKSSDQSELLNLLCDLQPQYIVHYAAINGTQYFYDIPFKVAEVNSIGTYNLLKSLESAMKVCDGYCPSFVFASTSEVYGEPFEIPSKETSLTYLRLGETRDSYAAAKLMSEFYVRLFAETLNFPWMIFRIFNVYGPRMVGTKYGQVIPEFITRLRGGEYPLKIFGDGSHTRSFIYVTDHVEMAFKAITSEGYNDVYNLGNPEEISIAALAEKIMNQLQMEPQFDLEEERSGDHKRRQPSIEKLISLIGKYDMVNIDEGLKLMVDRYKD